MNIINGGVLRKTNLPFVLTQRCFQTQRILRSELPKVVAPNETTKPKTNTIMENPGVNVSKFDKYWLVWGGKYKKLSDVPDRVSVGLMERTKNVARIKTNLVMIGMALAGCVWMIYLGKGDVADGKSAYPYFKEFQENIGTYSKK